jgi:hypothetical protein
MITTPKSKKGKEKCRPSPRRFVFHVAARTGPPASRARGAAPHPAGSFTHPILAPVGDGDVAAVSTATPWNLLQPFASPFASYLRAVAMGTIVARAEPGPYRRLRSYPYRALTLSLWCR